MAISYLKEEIGEENVFTLKNTYIFAVFVLDFRFDVGQDFGMLLSLDCEF